jgi:hypothetical protein
VTGGTPRTTGVRYDETFANDLADPKLCRAGEKTDGSYDYCATIDADTKAIISPIDPAKLAADRKNNCAPVFPHQLVRAITMLDVAKVAGGRTAWPDKYPAYGLVQCPTGKAIDDLFTPEIDAADTTDSIENAIAYDASKAKAIVSQISGLDHDGATKVGVQMIFGMNFQALSVGQKNKGHGYLNAAAEPSPGLTMALDAKDAALASIRAAFQTHILDASTLIVVTAKYGQSPIEPAKHGIVDSKSMKKLVEADTAGVVASVRADDVALIWLKDKSKIAAVAATLENARADLSIETILSGPTLAPFGDPSNAPPAGLT